MIVMPDDDNIQFTTKIRKRGSSWYVLLPQEIREHLNLRHGSNVKMQVEDGPFGPYISFWSPTQQAEGDNE